VLGILLGLLTLYGLGIGFVHLFASYCLWGRPASKHVVIVTYENETTLEGVLRALDFRANWSSIETKVTLLDKGSKDDTLSVAKRWMGGEYATSWNLIQATSEHEAQHWISQIGEVDRIIHLANKIRK
jgi:hypothetical protein